MPERHWCEDLRLRTSMHQYGISLLHCHGLCCFFSRFVNYAALRVCSEEASKENRDTLPESAHPGRCCKLPRISDVDMFGSDAAECQRMTNETADNCVQSSGEIEVVPPSPLPHWKSSGVQNTRVLMGSTVPDSELGKQKKKVGSYPSMEMSNDVEPDGSQLSTCVKSSHCEENSRHRAIVPVVDSTPVILPKYFRYHSVPLR